ncbi:uncharacterized protein SPPG_09039 [Spizellomyces punctatus DAOM BR117]|uniref:Retrotransposon gag domain-containing protein n=1 Tax=Spizellomyces punctatus (strain DAOM BR117) TaxID=645134 RepID=A0A0L0HMG1_SPIPD|nr:uncharacterized protein SPPG_09039 [Spizellomyces punctatus DAOM BR117]KND02090.1 hypothetical protein SPPG_09039 [Spizellomyces punctatus DAOM BR117]|eukprot:XP_016610129.1 hypothetical protein SPPG_09039 [Spizellomyces punctatus DAOM BR117]
MMPVERSPTRGRSPVIQTRSQGPAEDVEVPPATRPRRSGTTSVEPEAPNLATMASEVAALKEDIARSTAATQLATQNLTEQLHRLSERQTAADERLARALEALAHRPLPGQPPIARATRERSATPWETADTPRERTEPSFSGAVPPIQVPAAPWASDTKVDSLKAKDVPEFTGRRNQDVEEWLNKVQLLQNVSATSDARMVQLLPAMIAEKTPADAWFYTLEAQETRSWTWKRWKEELLREFRDPLTESKRKTEYVHCHVNPKEFCSFLAFIDHKTHLQRLAYGDRANIECPADQHFDLIVEQLPSDIQIKHDGKGIWIPGHAVVGSAIVEGYARGPIMVSRSVSRAVRSNGEYDRGLERGGGAEINRGA